MKIARANSLERLLITVSSDTREQIGGGEGEEGDERRKGGNDSCLSHGVEEPEEKWAPIFTTRVISGARDTLPPCKLPDERALNQ